MTGPFRLVPRSLSIILTLLMQFFVLRFRFYPLIWQHYIYLHLIKWKKERKFCTIPFNTKISGSRKLEMYNEDAFLGVVRSNSAMRKSKELPLSERTTMFCHALFQLCYRFFLDWQVDYHRIWRPISTVISLINCEYICKIFASSL